MKTFNKEVSNRGIAITALVIAAVGVAAVAGGGGAQQFGTLAQQLQSWAQGSLGIVIAIAALLVGLSIGVVKQSMMAVVTGLGIAIALYYGPQVIAGVLNAGGAFHSLPAMAAAALPIL